MHDFARHREDSQLWGRPSFLWGIHSREGNRIHTWRLQSKGLSLAPAPLISTLHCSPTWALPFLRHPPCFLPQHLAVTGVPFTYCPLSIFIILQGPLRCHHLQEASSDSVGALSVLSPLLGTWHSRLGTAAIIVLVIRPQLVCELLKGRTWSDASLYPDVTYHSSAIEEAYSEYWDKWMNEHIWTMSFSFTVFPDHLQCMLCVHKLGLDVVSSEWLHASRYVGKFPKGKQKLSMWVWKGTGLGIRKPQFLPQSCCSPVVLCDLGNSFLPPQALIYPSIEWELGAISEDLSSLHILPLAQSVSSALSLLTVPDRLQAQKLNWKRDGGREWPAQIRAFHFLAGCEVSVKIFPRWYLFSRRFHKLFHSHPLIYMWPVLKSHHEYEGQP